MFDHLAGFLPRMRLIVLAATTVGILIVVNIQIVSKEAIVADGETLLLRLAPRDPRSLLQGDYMALRYAMANEVARAAAAAKMTDGQIVVELAPDGEARFVALYEGQSLTGSQRILRFRRRGDSVRLAGDSYFFEEGQWDMYTDARFGELRVSEQGEAVLIGLRDRNGIRLGHAPH